MLTITRESEGLTARVPVKVFGSVHPARGMDEVELPELGLPIPIHRLIGMNNYPPHDHDHYELTFVVGGTGIHETAHGRIEVGRGSVHALAPGEVHSYEDVDRLAKVKCAYLGEWLLNDLHDLLSEGDLIPLFMHTVLGEMPLRNQTPQWQIDQATWEACAQELRDIALETQSAKPSLIRMKAALKKMMVVLDRSFTQSGGNLVLESELAPWMRRFLQRIEEAILHGEPLSVAAIADELGMSVKTFSRSFNHVFGSSPTQYYQHRRVQRACWMLLHSGKNITEIAHLLGYSDSAHFTRVFRRIRGVSPSEYRTKYDAP